MNHTTTLPANATGLRPDVAACVKLHAARAGRHRGRACDWQAYYAAKAAISRCCGWHAPAGQYDQAQFDGGIQAYLKAVRYA